MEPSLQTQIARSYALSRTYNPRNLESPWYAAWNHALFDLIQELPKFLINPQHTASYKMDDENHDESESYVDNEDIEQAVMDELAIRSQNSQSSESLHLLNVDTSFASTAATVHGRGDEEGFCDFAILYTKSETVKKLTGRYGHHRVTGLSVPVLIELKRFCERKFTGRESAKDVASLLQEAQDQVEQYARITFLEYRTKEKIVIIAGAGLWWCWAHVACEQCMTFFTAKPVKWSAVRKLNTVSSNKMLQQIKEILTNLPLPGSAEE